MRGPSNIKIQKTGAEEIGKGHGRLPASDLERPIGQLAQADPPRACAVSLPGRSAQAADQRSVRQSKGMHSGADVATMCPRLQGAVVVRAKLVKIGNSRGIRLAKPLLEVAGLADEVEIEAAPGVLTIRPSAHPRAGWAEAASSYEPEGLLDEMSATRFDDEEWSW